MKVFEKNHVSEDQNIEKEKEIMLVCRNKNRHQLILKATRCYGYVPLNISYFILISGGFWPWNVWHLKTIKKSKIC